MWREKLEIKKDNAIAGLYPSAKLCILGFYCCAVIILSTANIDGYPVYMMGAVIIPPALAGLSGVFPRFIRGFRRLCVLACVILASQTLLFPGLVSLWNVDIFGLFIVNIYENGLQRGLGLAFSILDTGGVFIWFFTCTESGEIVSALEKGGMSHKAGYVLLSTLKMIPLLRRNSKAVMSAQEARGVETEGSLVVRMKAFMPTLIPTVLGAINSAGERALALEARGFTSRGPKTRLIDLRPNGKEMRAVALAALGAVTVLIWRILIWAL